MSHEEIHDAEIVGNQEVLQPDGLPDVESLVPQPQMNVALPEKPPEQVPCPVTDEMLLGVYDEALDNIRTDRKEIDGLLANFVEMVINEGDSTTASKEALVKLVELKLETSEKITRVADLMTRVKLKERNTYAYSGPHLNALQQNTQNTYVFDKREMFREVKRLQNKITGKGRKKNDQP